MSGPVPFTVSFAKPGFFLMDARLTVTLDERTIYDGSFKAGFEVTEEVLPGDHTLTTRIAVGGTSRHRAYSVQVEPGREHAATLDYSRFWGNFKKGLTLSAR